MNGNLIEIVAFSEKGFEIDLSVHFLFNWICKKNIISLLNT